MSQPTHFKIPQIDTSVPSTPVLCVKCNTLSDSKYYLNRGTDAVKGVLCPVVVEEVRWTCSSCGSSQYWRRVTPNTSQTPSTLGAHCTKYPQGTQFRP